MSNSNGSVYYPHSNFQRRLLDASIEKIKDHYPRLSLIPMFQKAHKTEPEWPNGIQCCARRGFEPQTSTLICKFVNEKPSAAMLTSIQSADVAPEVNLRITQVRKCARDPPWLWNPRQTSPEVQNRGISGPRKRTMSSKNLKNKKIAHETTGITLTSIACCIRL